MGPTCLEAPILNDHVSELNTRISTSVFPSLVLESMSGILSLAFMTNRTSTELTMTRKTSDALGSGL
jgi:hypothetical protein